MHHPESLAFLDGPFSGLDPLNPDLFISLIVGLAITPAMMLGGAFIDRVAGDEESIDLAVIGVTSAAPVEGGDSRCMQWRKHRRIAAPSTRPQPAFRRFS